jgi:hypothetical protein
VLLESLSKAVKRSGRETDHLPPLVLTSHVFGVSFSRETTLPFYTSGVPRNFFGGGGSTNSVQDKGLRERGSGSGSPLVRGSAQFEYE